MGIYGRDNLKRWWEVLVVTSKHNTAYSNNSPNLPHSEKNSNNSMEAMNIQKSQSGPMSLGILTYSNIALTVNFTTITNARLFLILLGIGSLLL